jgi:hypothetical protein
MGHLASLPAERIRGHMRRHDVSRWLGDVFRDRTLSSRVQKLEDRARSDANLRDVAADIAQSIRARYEAPEQTAIDEPNER